MTSGMLDFHALDVLVRRAFDVSKRARAELLTAEGRERARFLSPFDGVREVTVQSTFRALREAEPPQALRMHRDGLARWVYELLQERVAWDLSIDEMDAAHAVDESLAGKKRAELERPVEESELARATDLGSRLVTFDQARRALVASPHLAATEISLDRAADLAPKVVAAQRELRARRFEAAHRLGLEHPWALAVPANLSAVFDLGRAVLDATEPLAAELHRAARRRAESDVAAQTVFASFAREASEGWPAHLTNRWLEEVFRGVAPRAPRLTALPKALGGASFVRAAFEWGFALRLGGIPRSLPFALARDPYPVDAYVFASVFAAAVADPVFARRKLGLGARSADAHGRALLRSILLGLRSIAAEVVCGASSWPRGDELEELTARIFGAPLPSDLAFAWQNGGFSGRARVDGPARLLGAVRAFGFMRTLVERYDEDWFENPRAAQHLANVSVGPVWQHDTEGNFGAAELAATASIAKAFEEALG